MRALIVGIPIVALFYGLLLHAAPPPAPPATFGGDHITPPASGGENSLNNPRATPPQSAPLERAQWEKDVDASLIETGDFATAVRIVWPLAAQGNAKAQVSLGLMYLEGWGVPQDYEKAFKWFHRAADRGDGQTWLGGMYENGTGVPQDYVRAYLWYNLAAHNSEATIAEYKLDFIARSMSPAQLAEAQKLATDWKPEPIRGALPKPEDVPNVRSYQAWLSASPTEEWIAEGDRRTVLVWRDEKSMKISHEMTKNAGPGKTSKTDLDDLLYDLARYYVCFVYPGTRVMVGTPGALSSFVTVMDPAQASSIATRFSPKCKGTVENSRLSDTPPSGLFGEAELLAKAPSNFSKLVTGNNAFYQDTFDQKARGLMQNVIIAYCRDKPYDCSKMQGEATTYMSIWLRHPDGGSYSEWLATPRTDDRLNRCAIREWPDMVAIKKCWT
jgi:hypothetical protein